MPPFPHFDKIVHLCVYALLGALLRRSFASSAPVYFWVSCILTSLYGITDEFHQSFIPGRNADIWDWLADTIGGMLGSYRGGISTLGPFAKKSR